MTITMLKRATAALLTPALLISTAPTFAAAPKPVKLKPPVLTCKTTASDGLSYTVIKTGKGDKPTADSKVKVNYRGLFKSDGRQFDAGDGAEFKIGGVIKGFGQGLQMMQPGGKIRLCLPSTLGYGEAGYGSVPGNADLVFEVELLSFTTPPAKPVVPLAERTCTQTTASGLGYAPITAGTGKTPTTADMALIDFTTFDAKSGVTFEKREWETVPIGQATAIFREALQMMQVGGSSRFCLPKRADASADEPEINVRVDLLDVRLAPVVDN